MATRWQGKIKRIILGDPKIVHVNFGDDLAIFPNEISNRRYKSLFGYLALF
jgi:hypothetical protein